MSGASSKDESHRLYAAWRLARANWDAERYRPEHAGMDLPEEIDGPLADADEAALIAYLLYPAHTLNDLSRKLRVFHSEGGVDFVHGTGALARLAEDARSLALQSLSAGEHVSERPTLADSAPRRHPDEEAKISEIDGAFDCIEFALEGMSTATEHCHAEVLGPLDAAFRIARQQIERVCESTVFLRYGTT